MRHEGGFDLSAVRRAIESGPVPPEIAAIWAGNGHNRYRLDAKHIENPGFEGVTVTKPVWNLANGSRVCFHGLPGTGSEWVRRLFLNPPRGEESAYRRLYLGDWSIAADVEPPPGEAWLVQNGRVAGRITGLDTASW